MTTKATKSRSARRNRCGRRPLLAHRLTAGVTASTAGPRGAYALARRWEKTAKTPPCDGGGQIRAGAQTGGGRQDGGMNEGIEGFDRGAVECLSAGEDFRGNLHGGIVVRVLDCEYCLWARPASEPAKRKTPGLGSPGVY